MAPTKKIVLTSCAACPFKDHRGALGEIRAIPVCRKKGKGTTLPYTVAYEPGRAQPYALGTNIIPYWCPLGDN